jgi:hypothetical protein
MTRVISGRIDRFFECNDGDSDGNDEIPEGRRKRKLNELTKIVQRLEL